MTSGNIGMPSIAKKPEQNKFPRAPLSLIGLSTFLFPLCLSSPFQEVTYINGVPYWKWLLRPPPVQFFNLFFFHVRPQHAASTLERFRQGIASKSHLRRSSSWSYDFFNVHFMFGDGIWAARFTKQNELTHGVYIPRIYPSTNTTPRTTAVCGPPRLFPTELRFSPHKTTIPSSLIFFTCSTARREI